MYHVSLFNMQTVYYNIIIYWTATTAAASCFTPRQINPQWPFNVGVHVSIRVHQLMEMMWFVVMTEPSLRLSMLVIHDSVHIMVASLQHTHTAVTIIGCSINRRKTPSPIKREKRSTWQLQQISNNKKTPSASLWQGNKHSTSRWRRAENGWNSWHGDKNSLRCQATFTTMTPHTE